MDIDGHVWAWGDNEYNQLGRGSDARFQDYEPVQVRLRVSKLTNLGDEVITKEYVKDLPDGSTLIQTYTERDKIVSVSAGEHFAMALSLSGYVYSWGSNQEGQLGNGNRKQESTNYALWVSKGKSPSNTNHMREVVSIAAGGASAAVLFSNGTLFSFGDNTYGQLGDGSVNRRYSAVKVEAGDASSYLPNGESTGLPGVNPNDKEDSYLNKVVAVAVGSAHTAAIALNVYKGVSDETYRVNPGLYAWGNNAYGQSKRDIEYVQNGVDDEGNPVYTDEILFYGKPQRMVGTDAQGNPTTIYYGARQVSAGFNVTLAQVESEKVKQDNYLQSGGRLNNSEYDPVQMLAWGDNSK